MISTIDLYAKLQKKSDNTNNRIIQLKQQFVKMN